MITRILLSLTLAAMASTALAGGVQYHWAPVVSVEPIYHTHRQPADRHVCWEETAYERAPGSQRSHTPTVVGAIIGGVIGNQFGGGSGQKAATVAGAALGGSIGRDAARQNHRGEYYAVTRERCTVQREFREQRVLSGYRVGYEFDGQVYYTQLDRRPGDAIRVRVAISPVG